MLMDENNFNDYLINNNTTNCSPKRNDSILFALDSVHRSLLLKNLEFEQLNTNPQTIICKPNNELNFYESEETFSHSLADEVKQQTGDHRQCCHKIDCDCLDTNFDSDSDGLRVYDEDLSMNLCKNEKLVSQCSSSSTLQNNKKITLKVNVNKCTKNDKISKDKDRTMHPKTLNRSIASSQLSSTDITTTSSSSSLHDSNIDEYYDCTDEKSFSSYYEDSISNCEDQHHHHHDHRSKSSSPMIEIIQEITQRHTVRSTIHLNKNKIQKYRQSLSLANNNDPTPKITKIIRNSTGNTTSAANQSKRRKSKQKSVRDNVHNELLDQYRDHSIDRDVTSDATTAGDCDAWITTETDSIIRVGKLEAAPEAGKSRRSSKPVGRLMSKRLERDRQQMNETLYKDDENGNEIPPIKPPRTFASSSITNSSTKSANDGNSSTTALVEDHHRSLSLKKNSSVKKQQRIGWQFSANDNDVVQSKPPDDLNHIEFLCTEDADIKYGWTNKPFADPDTTYSSSTQQVYNMLNYVQCNRNKSTDMTSFNLPPEPQQNARNIQPPQKESIDTVDFCTSVNQSPKCTSIATINSIFSTPPKNPNQQLAIEEICRKCQSRSFNTESPKIVDGFVRQSFKKNAFKRTKSFFQASRRKISAKMPSPYPTPQRMAYSDSEDYRTPAKSETTERMNCSPLMNDDSGKKSIKTLGFTPINYGYIESPIQNDEQIDQAPPPQKPIRRKHLAEQQADEKDNIGEKFDFQRIIQSPKRESLSNEHLKRNFKLSPKRLFKTFSNNTKPVSTLASPSKLMDKSYKSFAETDDDFIILMGEYLQRMCRKINGTSIDAKIITNHENVSISSQSLLEPQIIEIDCHRQPLDIEPIYSEINSTSDGNGQIIVPSHFCANNNPKAVYTIINKNLKPTISCDSITNSSALNMGNDLSVSIEKFLDQLIIDRDDGGGGDNWDSIKNSVESLQIIANNKPNICFTEIQEENDDRRKCERDHVQQSVCSVDNTSISTTSHLTENICDDVEQGDEMNDDIARMIERIETMDPFLRNSQRSKAVPEESDISSIGYYEKDDGFVHHNYAEYSEINTAADIKDKNSPELLTLPLPPIPKHNKSSQSSITEQQLKSPSSAVKNFTIKLRNSFSKGTNYIRTSIDKRKSMDSPRLDNKSKHLTAPQSPTSTFSLRLAPSLIELSDMYMLQLNSQMTYQQEIRRQLKKAIDLCRNMKEFQCSTELVEAERLMLLSHKKEMAAKNELIRIDYDGNGMQINPEKCCGNITINDIKIQLKPEHMYDTYFNYFYVCVCTYRDQVVATFGRERCTNDAIEFKNLQNMQFNNLEPDFKIQIEIYVLRLNKASTSSPHGNNSMKEDGSGGGKLSSAPILSPIKLFASLTTGMSPSTTNNINYKLKFGADKSRFRLHGTTAITSFHLPSSRYVENCRHRRRSNDDSDDDAYPYSIYFASVTKQFQCLLADQVNLEGSIIIEFNSEIQLKNTGHRGFLCFAKAPENYDFAASMMNCGENLEWTRRWCIVDGCKINLWNETGDEKQNKPPLLSLDLTKCATDAIQLADKRTCSMPKTFILEMYKDFHDNFNNVVEIQMETFFITTESNTDLIKWLTELNRILKFIKDWNI